TVLSAPAPYLAGHPVSLEVQGDTTVTLVLERGPLVTLQLVDEQGAPIQHDGAYLYVSSLLGSSVGTSLQLARGRSEVATVLLPGTYGLSISFSSGGADTPPPRWPSQDLGRIWVAGEGEHVVVVKAGARVSGVVRGEDGEPVSGGYAYLYFEPRGGAAAYTSGGTAIGGRGRYAACLLPGEYSVRYGSYSLEGTPSQDLGTITVTGDREADFVVRPGVRVTLTVVDEEREPVASAFVYLRVQQAGGYATLSYGSLAGGTAVLQALPGVYEVGLSPMVGSGPFPSQILGTVDASGPTQARFVARRGVSVSGRVTDSGGSPVGSASLSFSTTDPSASSGYGSVADDGTYSTCLFPGTYQVSLYAYAGGLPQQGVGTLTVASDTTADFVAQLGEGVEGRLVDAAGAGAAGLTVSAYRVGGDYFASSGATDASGAFRLALVPGTYAVSAARSGPDGYATCTWNLGQIEVPSSVPPVLVLPSGATLTGRVTGAGGRGVRAVLYLTPDTGDARAWRLTGAVLAETGLDGRYEMAADPGPRDSVAYVSQMVSLDRSLLTERVGRVSGRQMALILSGIDVVLGR
ncbi:MAG: carboxypeptidase regulatory-like domain-containing protein, partial [Candidatus Latescibacterota bacterium]